MLLLNILTLELDISCTDVPGPAVS